MFEYNREKNVSDCFRQFWKTHNNSNAFWFQHSYTTGDIHDDRFYLSFAGLHWILRRIFLNSSLTIFHCTLDWTLHNIAQLHPTKVCFPGKEIHYQGSYQRSKCHENRSSNNSFWQKSMHLKEE